LSRIHVNAAIYPRNKARDKSHVEKDFMLELIKKFSALYFAEILGFCLMGNHFHLLVKMIPKNRYTDEQIRKRFETFYGDSREFNEGQIP